MSQRLKISLPRATWQRDPTLTGRDAIARTAQQWNNHGMCCTLLFLLFKKCIISKLVHALRVMFLSIIICTQANGLCTQANRLKWAQDNFRTSDACYCTIIWAGLRYSSSTVTPTIIEWNARCTSMWLLSSVFKVIISVQANNLWWKNIPCRDLKCCLSCWIVFLVTILYLSRRRCVR